MSLAIYTLVLLLGSSPPGGGRPLDEPMTTERPFFTVTPDVPELGRFQGEGGVSWRRTAAGHVHRLGEGLFRLGLPADGELRVHLLSYEHQDFDDPGASGFTDVVLGYKKRLRRGGGGRPAVALVLESTLPTGSAGLRSSDPLPRAELAAAWQLGGRLRLRTAAGYARRASATDASHGEWHGGATVEVRLSPAGLLSRRWTAFAEVWGLDDDVTGGWSAVQGGVLYRFYDFQVDVRVGRGLNGWDGELLAGAGLTIKW